MDISNLLSEQRKILKHTPDAFRRYAYDTINWRNRMICILGPRGVGKTTLVLQYIKHSSVGGALYYSVDNVLAQGFTLVELADEWVKNNGRCLVVDEIHKYPLWSQELKYIYDSQPELKVIFTGSSVLDIFSGMADLSRRVALYEMQGLSFREYLALFHGRIIPMHSLDEILAHHYELPGIGHPLPLFRDYLRRGYYPFGMEVDFERKLNQSVLQTMENDIPVYANMNASTGQKLRRLLTVIANSVPFKPVLQKLAEEIGVSRNQIADYLLYMERAGMIAQLRDETGGVRSLGKVEKVYLDNPNLCIALSSGNPNIGNVRETFFFNQMRVGHDIVSSKKGDFCVEDLTFEIGGRNKGQKQVRDVENAYIVRDDMEFGALKNIPLWAFGLTY
ncbi:MAG: ATP-binding protein [Bacteroidales bacterium]|nr:ATP-binding protein [Bacteroidales bacterium]